MAGTATGSSVRSDGYKGPTNADLVIVPFSTSRHREMSWSSLTERTMKEDMG